MPHPTPPLGATLDLWLNRLDAEGFRVGIRERLIVQDFLTRLAARGELPEAREAALKLVAPLICTTPESQRRYVGLLREFLATQPRRHGRHAGKYFGRKQEARADEAGPPHWLKLVGVGLLVLVVLAGLAWHFWPEPDVKIGPNQDTKATTSQDKGQQTQANDTYTPPPPPPKAVPATPADTLKSLRQAAWTLAGLSALLLAWTAAARLGRRLYLQGVRSDAQVEEHVLHDPHAGRIEPQTVPVRVASRGLRQRIAGEREVLDLDATLAATIQAAGAFSPRWRLLQHTPEYLALIDRRHPADHLAAYAEALVQALVEHGVTVQVYHFEGSPDHGCWRLRQGAAGREAFDRSGMAELAGRYGGHRLLVFGAADALVDPLTGAPRPWTKQLRVFRQRAWFTPMPLPSWSAAEEAADAQGFLVLPMPAEALTTLAGWFSSGDLSLAAGADWPLAYPALLRDQAVAWVARQSAPPEEVLKELLYQLRAYLGGSRYQWLCACAIFPSLSPTLTLALGKELGLDTRELDNRELALGMATLGALPWYRHGRMPAWLRQALLAELTPENEARYRDVIQQRLAGALEGEASTGGAELARVATRRRLWAWLGRGSGPARDVVLVDFLRKDMVSRLAQALPEPLRQRLFRNGLAAQGLRPALLAGLAGLCTVSLGLALFLPHQAPLQPPGKTPHPFAIHLVGCPDGAGVDAATRALADELAALSPDRLGITQAGAYLAPTAYTPAAWEKAHGQPAPGTGAIRYGAGYAGQAARLRDWLQPRIGAWINPASANTPAALIANVCVKPLVPPKNGQAGAPGISVYIQIGAEAQRSWAERISERLRLIPKVTIHVELLDMKRLPNRIEVRSRVGGNPDFLKRIADELAGSLATPAVTKALQILKSDPTNANVYEIWASNRLCIQDLAPACGVVSAKPANIREFLATRPAITAGEASDLCYAVDNAARLNLDPGRQGFKNTAKGCVTVTPRQTTTYTLTAYARDGAETTRRVTVQVRESVVLVRVPSVLGLPVEQARDILSKLGFKLKQIDLPGATRTTPGTVLAQQPAAGGELPAGGVVLLSLAAPARTDTGWCCILGSASQRQQGGVFSMDAKECASRDGVFYRNEGQAMSECANFAGLGQSNQAPEKRLPNGWEQVNVAEIQGLLAKAGYYKGPQDGTVRDDLIKALMLFQEKYGQAPDGIPGPRTLSILRGQTAPPSAPGNLRMQN